VLGLTDSQRREKNTRMKRDSRKMKRQFEETRMIVGDFMRKVSVKIDDINE
jgi:hypothetical protein